jgi:hypothetical protein
MRFEDKKGLLCAIPVDLVKRLALNIKYQLSNIVQKHVALLSSPQATAQRMEVHNGC